MKKLNVLQDRMKLVVLDEEGNPYPGFGEESYKSLVSKIARLVFTYYQRDRVVIVSEKMGKQILISELTAEACLPQKSYQELPWHFLANKLTKDINKELKRLIRERQPSLV